MMPHEADDMLIASYPRWYDKFTAARAFVVRAEEAGRSLGRMANALNNPSYVSALGTPFADDPFRR
jgi:hypothetical protein